MCFALREPVSARWLAAQLGLVRVGPDRPIGRICNLACLAEDGLAFALAGRSIAALDHGVVVALDQPAEAGVTLLASPNPRLDFIRAQYLLARMPGLRRDESPAEIDASATLGRGAVVEDGVRIGAHTTIGPNAVILRGTRIGRHCEIQSGAVIGDTGFGFERDPGNRPLRMIHLGGVLLGDHVEIGANTCIARGALGDTVLDDYVKINNLVHVAHNCHVGEGTIIGACADLCGSVTVGRNCWIAPNATIRQKLAIGDEAIVGMGAVVVKDVAAGATVYGNPAIDHADGEQARRLRPAGANSAKPRLPQLLASAHRLAAARAKQRAGKGPA